MIFFRPVDCKDLIADTNNNNVFISAADNERLGSSSFPPGALLITKIGNSIGDVSVVPSFVRSCNISGNMMGVVADAADPYFLCAYLKSSGGQLQFGRGLIGGPMPKIDMESVAEIQVPQPHINAQRYIGDKVRLAERLRERARSLYSELIQPFDSLVSADVRALGASRSWRVSASGLENRLDPGANHIRLVALRRELRAAARVRSLGDFVRTPLAAGVSLSNFTHGGPLYVRISDFERGYWDDSAASVSPADHSSNAKGHLRHGDVVYSRIGTVGRVGFADAHVPTSSLSNNCSLLRPIDSDDGAWIFWALRSAVGQVQASCLRSQTAQPKIANEDIESIILPDPQRRPTGFNQRTEEHFFAARSANALTRVATLLVENLIEGKVNEADLVAAQKALESGDRGLDRAILQALRQNGNPAQPLIADLDGLYALLDELDQETNA